MSALKPLLAEAGGQAGGTAFERDAAVVLRRVEEAARGVRASDAGNRRAFLDLLGRVISRRATTPASRQRRASARERPAAVDPPLIARYTWGFPCRQNACR